VAATRRLAAIMFTDIADYTSLAQHDEPAALRLVQEQERLVRPLLEIHRGRHVKSMGDGLLIEFPNALDAVECAVDLQRHLQERNDREGPPALRVRVGIHLGDVQGAGVDILGDAVNVASRIEPLAEPGGVCLSEDVFSQVRNKVPYAMETLGPKSLKGVQNPFAVYRVVIPGNRPAVSPEEAGPTRLAVLPFVNFSPDPKDEYFSDGMTEEIISAVSGIHGLSVISRTSVMGYKGTTKKVKDIGRELEVGSVLEGSLRKSGNRIRVTAQLIDVLGDRHVWAQNYDRELDDVFAVQSDVAKQVADALRVRLALRESERIERKPTENTTAYTLYLQGRYLWNKRGVENVRKAAEYFEQAVQADGRFALGYAGQADCWLILHNWGVDLPTSLANAEAAVIKALDIDPGLAEAHATLGLVFQQKHDRRRAEEEFLKAIQMKPSYATAHQWYFLLLLSQLRWDEALGEIRAAAELDPLSPVINYNHGIYYLAKRDYPRALELFRRANVLDPSYAPVLNMMAIVYGRTKRFEEMRRCFAMLVERLQGSFPSAQRWADANCALLEDDVLALRRVLPLVEEVHEESGHATSFLATTYFHLGEIDTGFKWLQLAFDRGEDLEGIQYEQEYDAVRFEPRYLDLLKRLGFDSARAV
jgi:adenylate cyclase